MTDNYPASLKVEIDRPQLRKYLRAKLLLTWSVPLLVFGGMLGFGAIPKGLARAAASPADLALVVVSRVLAGMGVGLLVSLVGYGLFSHRVANRHAASLQVDVEGAFLRIRQDTSVFSDRKLHFRSIVDYAETQDRLMRFFGISALLMTTPASGYGANVTIPGVKNCLQVRDLLADIDSARERA